MDTYLTVLDETTTEYVEKRSRFITTLRHCETEAEASAFLDEMRSKYWDATHNCYAYTVAEGKTSRFSDDGEPHGTAGKPMMDVVEGSKIKNIAVVVTRYFGGVLLGTGGLVRAYSKAVQDVLSKADVYKMVPSAVLQIVCDYPNHQKLVNLLSSCGCEINDTVFTENVKVEFSLPETEVETFGKKLTETFSARLNFEIKNKKLMPFKEK